MSRGPGTPSRDLTSVVLCSSRMMSMQSSTHSSQMNTVGPAISFLTSCWLLPQKEQYSVFFESLPLDLVIATPSPGPAGPSEDGLALRAARGLVDHDSGVRQREALAMGASGKQQRAHRGGLADAHRRYRRADVLHRIVDRETRCHHAARRIDVEGDVLGRVLRFEE